MKSLLFVLGLIASLVCIAYGQRNALRTPGLPDNTNFPGYGPFNPKPKPLPHWRFRRDNGQLHAYSGFKNGHYQGSTLDFEKKVFENGHGTITTYGGGTQIPNSRPDWHAGVRGVFTFGGEGRVKSEDERLFDSIMQQHRRKN